MHTESVKYLRDMVRNLAQMAEKQRLATLAYILRMAEEEANQSLARPLKSAEN